MDTQFSPEFIQSPSDLTGVEVLNQLPEHYLAYVSASNYVALGVVYTIMGLGIPEGVDPNLFLDKTLTGVFTMLNDKAVALGLPAFEPPTPITNFETSKIATILDGLILSSPTHLASTTSNHYVDLLHSIFGTSGHTASPRFKSRVVDAALIHLREELDLPFPPSVSEGGPWDYDGIAYEAFRAANIPQDLIEDGVQWMVINKLSPDSTWVKSLDPSKASLVRFFTISVPYFAKDFRKSFVNKYSKELVLEGNDDLELDLDRFESSLDRPDPDDAKECLASFAQFLREHAQDYHRDADSLTNLFGMLFQGAKPTVIRQELKLSPSSYSNRYNAIKAAAADFVTAEPKYRELLDPILGS